MIVLGLDPGIERTGYAFFKLVNKKPALISYGCIQTPKTESISERIGILTDKLNNLVKINKPSVLAIEQIFFNVNKKSVIAVAQAQGAVLALAAQYNMIVKFITPLQVKESLTGYGRSDKKSVEKMLKIIFGFKEIPKPDDIGDAIACGLAYCYRLNSAIHS